MSNYVTGAIKVNNLLVYSQRGLLDLTQSFTAASIYESIFTPGIVCDIVVIDTKDQMGTLILSGDETVIFNAQVEGSVNANYTFHLYEIGEVKSMGAQKSKLYVLKCVSEEVMYAKTNYVSTSYNRLCSEMVQDIHENYLKSTKPIVVENTKGPQLIVVPNLSPFDAIGMIRKRAVSSENKSSIFSFFETRENGNQTYKFVTIESLFKNSPAKVFSQSDAVSADILNITADNNIISYKIPRQLSSIDKIDLAGARKISQYNTTTGQYESNIIITSDTSYATGGSSNTDVSASFLNKYLKSNKPKQALLTVDWSQRPVTNLPESSADFQAYLALLLQNSMKIRVPGDTLLTCGMMITCNIPNKQGLSGQPKNDPLLSGNFLISRIHHRIGQSFENPRYTCIIECIKGKYGEGV
jgi:hypothetical protein